MNFKSIIILITFTLLSFADTRYDIKLHVDDPEERYRVFIKLYISNEHEVKKVNFTYPDYECKGNSAKVGWSNNTIDIKEKIIKGRCDSTYYLFYFTEDGQDISSVKIKNGRKYISTKINSMEVTRNIIYEERKKTKNTYYRNGNIKCKTRELEGDFDAMIECFYENGLKKNIVRFRLGKAVKGTSYNRDGSFEEMTEANFAILGYDYGVGITNENGLIQNLDD